MTEPCRVLVLNERDPRHPRAGGAEIHVAEIFERLAARGLAVTLASMSFPGCTREDRISGLEVRRLGRLRSYYPAAAAFCARETRRGRYDVVVECLNKLPYFSPLYSRAPVVALCHHLFGETAFLQVRWPYAATVWAAERLIPLCYRRVPFLTISESSRQDLIQRGVPAERVRVSVPGIRRPCVPLPPREARGERVVYVGRLERYKRVDVFLHAMAALRERFPRAEILVIGRGSAAKDLARLAQELGLAERTRFTGFVSDDERDALVADARVCVCPSTKEGWGLTVIESNALGTPVVATDAPGLRDSVRHGETGLLVPDGNVPAFAREIRRLIEDDALWDRLSVAGLDWSKRFDWDAAAADMAEVIEIARSRR
jgi:glycosyltransferase involved in cell wall biosynthesis